jgi:ABC-type transport system involved in multi-copper enzyme maturation permease subunit
MDHTLSRGGGIVVLLGWLVLFTAVAAVLLRRRDVT